MIPILYEKTETLFVDNGLGRLRDCISCTVTEERNGIYECDFEYPVDGVHFNDILCGRIIAVEHDDTNDVQPFDIVSYSKPINGVVSFHAVHISYRQSYLTVSGTNINSLASAFTLLQSAQPSNPFTYWTDKTSTGYMAAADGVPRSVRQMLGGVEGSILDAYRGEYEWDRFTVKLWSQRGTDRPFTIRYGVNMTDYNDDTDYSGAYTSVIPYWTGSDDSGDVIVKASRTDSGLPSYNGRNDCIPLDLTDKFEDKPTTAQLQQMALQMMASQNSNMPSQSISVSFIRLQDSAEYAYLAPLLQCRLCDTIKVEFPRYGMSGTYKIVKTVYNVLLERFEEMDLGTLSTTLAEALGIGGDSNIANPSAKYPIKTVLFGWVCSPAFSAGSRLIADASPSNSINPSDVPSGYTFVCWVQLTSVGWVGAPYMSSPNSVTSNIWSPTQKPATSGTSITGLALYIRSDLT